MSISKKTKILVFFITLLSSAALFASLTPETATAQTTTPPKNCSFKYVWEDNTLKIQAFGGSPGLTAQCARPNSFTPDANDPHIFRSEKNEWSNHSIYIEDPNNYEEGIYRQRAPGATGGFQARDDITINDDGNGRAADYFEGMEQPETSPVDEGVEREEGSSEDQELECDAGFGFSWLICGAISIFQSFMDVAKDILSSLLSVTPLERTNTEGEQTPIYSTWSSVRNIANVFLVPVFLFLIFAQATSFNIDTYTVKKMIPRLVAAAILIQASFFLVALAVDITNVLGKGIESLVLAPISNETLDFSGTGESATIAGALGLAAAGVITGGLATLAGGALAIFLFFLPIIIAIVATFFTLILRLIIIVLLAVLSPIAFLLWILPNTEKWFKQWLDMLTKALLMFPLIMMLLASGSLVALIATNFSDEGAESSIGALIGFVAIMAPLFIVPFTYKLAGTAVSVIGGTVSKLTNKAAVGGDGKGGITKGLRERKEQRDTDVAAGIAPENLAGRAIMKSPGLRRGAAIGARPGLGIGKKSEAQALGKFNQQIGEAGKTLENEGINDPDVLNEFAQYGENRSSFNDRLQKLRNSSNPKEQEKAEKLKSMVNHAGKNEMQAAALKRVAERGDAEQKSFDSVGNAFAGQPQVGKQVVADAAFAASKGGRPDLKAANTGKTYEATIKGMSTEEWQNLKPKALRDENDDPTEFARALRELPYQQDKQGNRVHDQRGNPVTDEEGTATLRNILGPQSGLSPDKRTKIKHDAGVSDEFLKPPRQDTNIEAVGGQKVSQPSPEATQGAVPVREQGGGAPPRQPQQQQQPPAPQPQQGPTLPGEQQRSSGLYVPGRNTTGGGVSPEEPSQQTEQQNPPPSAGNQFGSDQGYSSNEPGEGTNRPNS